MSEIGTYDLALLGCWAPQLEELQCPQLLQLLGDPQAEEAKFYQEKWRLLEVQSMPMEEGPSARLAFAAIVAWLALELD